MIDYSRLEQFTLLTPLDPLPSLDEIRELARDLMRAEEELDALRYQVAEDEAWRGCNGEPLRFS